MPAAPPRSSSSLGLALLALGVVFGDIGTSPLYAYQTAIGIAGAGAALGVASLIVWTIVLVVGVKYTALVMRTDYHGEGGIFALMARFFNGRPPADCSRKWFPVMLVFGAALLFGDGAITPAISVLSAIEGLAAVDPGWDRLVLPLTAGILLVLFAAQSFGTGRLGVVFGPVMVLWFASIGLAGAVQIAQAPGVLAALNPWLAIETLARGGWGSWALVGAAVLAVTGAEALYADLGHFGRPAILRAWRFLVFPALVLNYLGQAALVLQSPDAAANSNLFFLLVPNGHLRGAMVVLATAATVIASQALISGVFSLASQAMDLGYLPRLFVRHTSAVTRGQIYIPVVNFLLAALCLMLVFSFRTSESLASAYGIAVTGAMAITSVAFFMVKKNQPGARLGRWLAVLAGLLVLDLSLFGASLTKLEGGGFVPILIALAVTLVLLTWSKGRSLVHAAIQKSACAPAELARRLASGDTPRVPGTHVFVLRMASPDYGVARVLEQRRRNQVLPQAVVILELEADWHDATAAVGAIEATPLPAGLWQVRATHGYMVEPDVPMILEKARVEHGVELPAGPVFYFLCQEIIQTCTRRQMRHWEKLLFGFLSRNVLPGPDYLSIPPDQLIVYNWILRLAPSDGACP